MPAKSKAQQAMFGIAHAIQKGTMPASKAKGPATDVAKAAKPKDVKDFASTKTKNLPKKVKKEGVEDYTDSQLNSISAILGIPFRTGPNPNKKLDTALRKLSKKDKQSVLAKVKKEQIGQVREYVTKVVREVLSEWSVAPPNTGAGQSEWEIWNGGKIKATAPNRDAAIKLKNRMKQNDLSVQEGDQEDYEAYKERVAQKRKERAVKTEAYNRGTATISISRDGNIHWRTSDGQYDADLPGKRTKEHVKRRLAQLKKQLWGYTLKVIDDHGILKEAVTELRWVDGNLEKFYSRIKGPEAMVKKEIKRIEAKLKSQGRRSSIGSISRRTVDPKSSKNDGKWTKVTGRTLSEAGKAGKTWYLNWYDEKKKKWFEKEFKSERDADREFEKMRDNHPNISYGTDNSIYG